MFDALEPHTWPGLLILAVMALPYGLLLIDRLFKTTYACNYFGWHNGGDPAERGFDGCSMTGVCSKCGAPVLQDSQGNWFSVNRPVANTPVTGDPR